MTAVDGLVSTIIPAYNREGMVGAAVRRRRTTVAFG